MISASILGYGIHHSLGTDESFFSAYKDFQNNGFTAPENLDLDCSSLATLLPNVPLRRIPKYAKMGLIAAINTLKMADITIQNDENKESATLISPQQIGLVIASAYSGTKMNFDFMDSILENGPHLSSPTAFSHAVNNMGAGLLSLLLNIQGGCQTVSQFDLSFAGALQTALLLINSGRNDYVLLGVIDENDKRFEATCGKHLTNGNAPLTEGAIFFLLGKTQENKINLSLSWQKEIQKENLSQDNYISGMNSPLSTNILPQNAQFINNAAFYGINPFHQALDTLLAVHQQENASILADLCQEENFHQCAHILCRS